MVAHSAAGQGPYLHALEAIDAGDTVTDGQHAAQVDDWGLVLLLPLLDRGDQLLAHCVETK